MDCQLLTAFGSNWIASDNIISFSRTQKHIQCPFWWIQHFFPTSTLDYQQLPIWWKTSCRASDGNLRRRSNTYLYWPCPSITILAFPRMWIQPPISVKKFHHRLVGSHNVFTIACPRMAGRIGLYELPGRANHFISNRKIAFLILVHIFILHRALAPFHMNAVDTTNTSGQTHCFVLVRDKFELQNIFRHVDEQLFKACHQADPFQNESAMDFFAGICL